MVYLYNKFDVDVIATYSYRQGNARIRKNITVKQNTLSYDDAVKNNSVLGYNMLDNNECTLVDYQLESSSRAFSEQKDLAVKSLIERNKAEAAITIRNLQSKALANRTGGSLQEQEKSMAEPTVVQTKVNILNCSQECNGEGSPTLRCLKGTPPDQTTVRSIQQKLLEPLSDRTIGITDIQKLVGQPNECSRQDIKATPTTLLSNGDACAYPFYFNSSDKSPSIVIHYPTTVSANRVDQYNLSAIEFKAPAETPILSFRDRDINEVWGGRIIQIAADAKGVYYQTTGGCVALEVK
jgi:hypothetical protein